MPRLGAAPRGGRPYSLGALPQRSVRARPPAPFPFRHPTSKLSLSLRPVQPPSCKNLKSDSQLPPATSQSLRLALRFLGQPGWTAGASAAVCGEGVGRGDRPLGRRLRACGATAPCCLGLGSPARPDDLGSRFPRYLRWKRQRQ